MTECWRSIYSRSSLYNQDIVESILDSIKQGTIRNTTRGTEAAMYAHETNNANPYCNPMSCFTHEPALDLDDCFNKIRNYLDTSSSAHGINVSMFDLTVDWRPKVVDFLMSYKDKDKLHIADSIIRFTVCLWHKDIEHFLNSLTSFESRTDIFSWCVGIYDDSLDAVKTRSKWSLYEPTIDLINNYDSAKQLKPVKEVDAYELYTRLMKAQCEHKFAIINLSQMNKLNMNPNLGNITCTNICTEITGLGAFVCCLGSINLNTCVDNSKIVNTDLDPNAIATFNFDRFQRCVRDLVYHLNYLIEITNVKDKDNYSHFAKKVLRAIGIGLAALADCFVMLNITYESDEAYNLLDKLLYLMTLTAVETSLDIGLSNPELCAQGYKGSKWSEGLLPFDLAEHEPHYRELDREVILRDRMRCQTACNCNFMTMMPNFGRSSEGNTPSINPISSLMYTHINAYKYQVINFYKYLPEKFYSAVERTNGEYTCGIDEIYKTVTVMDPIKVRNMKKLANDYCDMSISNTHHIKVTPGMNKHSSIISILNLYLRFKTCVYYMRENIYYNSSEDCSSCSTE